MGGDSGLEADLGPLIAEDSQDEQPPRLLVHVAREFFEQEFVVEPGDPVEPIVLERFQRLEAPQILDPPLPALLLGVFPEFCIP